MRILIVTLGSRGDVQPYVALGKGLQAAGYAVKIATHRPFEAFVRRHGLDFAPVASDPREELLSQRGQAWVGSGQNPVRFFYRFYKLSVPYIEQMMRDVWAAAQDADAVIAAILGLAGLNAAEARRLPAIFAPVQPVLRTRFSPSVAAPECRKAAFICRRYNLLTHIAWEYAFWLPFHRIINRARRDIMGLPPYSWKPPFAHIARGPVLNGFSPLVVPPPPDWPPHVCTSGYWFLLEADTYTPPADLDAFLADGPPPVYIGFGSMPDPNPEQTANMVLDAVQRAGVRAVLARGWAGLQPHDVPDTVFLVDEVPHDWLFPRMAALVHHCGAGTTAAGLRAGVPTIGVPHFADQPFWARRIQALGVGPRPIPRQHLTTDRLTAALLHVVHNQTMREAAAHLGEQIRAEDGVGRAVAYIREQFGAGRAFWQSAPTLATQGAGV